MNENLRWRKMKKREYAGAEALLRDNEQYCVGACSRFINRDKAKDSVWTLCANKGEINGLILYSRSSLMPVLCGEKDIPMPGFLSGFFSSINIHSVQGLRNEAIVMEKILEKTGRITAENIDYDLMVIDNEPGADNFSSGPANLKLRIPEFTDLDSLAVMQADYEREEVLPRGAKFNAAASRINLERIIAKQDILAAELNGQLVGKINVNAVSFTRFQVGGVYVHPDFRGIGIARRMTAEFIRFLVKQGRGVTLFVKKSNHAAQKLYNRLGFTVKGDYRISYY